MLQIQVKATNTTLTPAISDYIEKKIGSLSKFIDPNDTSALADVEIGKTSNHHQGRYDLFRAEVNLHVSKMHLRTEASNEDLYSAIDDAKDQIHRELVSKKSKVKTLFRRGGQAVKNILKGIYPRKR